MTCEVGFGTGMGSAIFLTATSTKTSSLQGGVHHVFEYSTEGPFLHNAQMKSYNYLKKVFGEHRIQVRDGRSQDTIKDFQETCDIWIIDGDHTFEGVLSDIAVIQQNRATWRNETILLLDDVQMPSVENAISQAIDLGWIQVVEEFKAEAFLDTTFSSQLGWRVFPHKDPKRFLEARLCHSHCEDTWRRVMDSWHGHLKVPRKMLFYDL